MPTLPQISLAPRDSPLARSPLLLLLLLSSLACRALAALPVAVSVLPQKTFVEAVGGEAVTVQVLVAKGYDPALYEPRPRQLARLSQAQLYVRAGVPFEAAWLPRFRQLNPRMRILDMREGLPLIPLAEGGGDPHVWTDPTLVKAHAARLRDALTALDPANGPRYAAGYQAFAERLDALDEALARRLAPLQGRAFLVFHPAWSYFARRYGLRQLAVEQEGKEPNARSLAALIDQARALNIRAVFVQPQHAGGTARVVAKALGARLVSIDPLAEDYFATLRKMADLLVETTP